METKVLSAIMKLQACQLMLADVAGHTDLTINNQEHGSLSLTAYVDDGADAREVIKIINAYTFKGAEFRKQHYAGGTTDAFTTYELHAYISDLED